MLARTLSVSTSEEQFHLFWGAVFTSEKKFNLFWGAGFLYCWGAVSLVLRSGIYFWVAVSYIHFTRDLLISHSTWLFKTTWDIYIFETSLRCDCKSNICQIKKCLIFSFVKSLIIITYAITLCALCLFRIRVTK